MLGYYKVSPTGTVLRSIYTPYIAMLLHFAQLYPFDRGIRGQSRRNLRFYLGKLRAVLSIGKDVLCRRYVFYINGLLIR
jgi:hypothetical protein